MDVVPAIARHHGGEPVVEAEGARKPLPVSGNACFIDVPGLPLQAHRREPRGVEGENLVEAKRVERAAVDQVVRAVGGDLGVRPAHVDSTGRRMLQPRHRVRVR